MEKIEIIRVAFEVVGTLVIAYLSAKTFKYKDSLTAIIEAAKDARVTEDEFQKIVDVVKKDIYG